MFGGTGSNPRNGGGGDNGGGGGGGRSSIIQGAARDLNVQLTTDQQTLVITLTPNDNALYVTGANYAVYWLDPAVFSYNDIYGGLLVGPNGLLPLSSRTKVCDVSGGSGIVSAKVPYVQYQTGGWMYAVVIPYNGTTEYRLNGTNFVAVPVIGASGQPSSTEIPVVPWVIISNQGGTKRLCQFGWTNAATLQTVAYVKIAVFNYFNDNAFRDIAIYKVNTAPGARQGTINGANSWPYQGNSAILEPDNTVSPGHNITFYFVPMTAALVALPYASCNAYTLTNIT
jgi:hypothetical protein